MPFDLPLRVWLALALIGLAAIAIALVSLEPVSAVIAAAFGAAGVLIAGWGDSAPRAVAAEAAPPAPLAVRSPALADGRIADLTAAVGAGVVRQMLEMLAEEARTRPPAIRALALADPIRARAEAHGLKGAAASIGAMPLAEAAQAVEMAGAEALMPAIEALEAAAAQTIAALACAMPDDMMPDDMMPDGTMPDDRRMEMAS